MGVWTDQAVPEINIPIFMNQKLHFEHQIILFTGLQRQIFHKSQQESWVGWMESVKKILNIVLQQD